MDYVKTLLEQEMRICAAACGYVEQAIDRTRRLVGSPNEKADALFHLGRAANVLEISLAEARKQLWKYVLNPPAKNDTSTLQVSTLGQLDFSKPEHRAIKNTMSLPLRRELQEKEGRRKEI